MLIKTKFRIPDVFFGMILAVAIFVIGALFVNGPNQPNNEGNTQQHRTEEAQQKSSGAVADDLIFGHPALTVYTGVLAFATILLMGFTGWGIYNQIKETKILQRAYISVEPGGVSVFLPRNPNCLPNGKIFVGHARFRNAGRLPATNLQWWMDSLHTDEAEYEPIEYGGLTGNNAIPPAETMTQGSIQKEIPSDRGYFYVWGKVVYNDGFEDGRETRFCHRYNCRRLAWDEETGFRRIRARYGRHHDKGNDAT